MRSNRILAATVTVKPQVETHSASLKETDPTPQEASGNGSDANPHMLQDPKKNNTISQGTINY